MNDSIPNQNPAVYKLLTTTNLERKGMFNFNVKEQVEAVYATNNNPWDEVSLGQINDDEELIWDLKTEPHLLIVGHADTGKTNVARRVIDHIRAQDNMKVSIADIRREGYRAYANDENVDEVAVKPIDATHLILHARAEMKERLALMLEKGAKYREMNLPELIYVIDGVEEILPSFGCAPSDKAVAADYTRQALTEILRIGGTAGIHLVIISQSRKVDTLLSDNAEPVGLHIVMGNFNEEVCESILGERMALRDLKRGQGVARSKTHPLTIFTAYWQPLKTGAQ